MEIKDKNIGIGEASGVSGINMKSLVHMIDRGDLSTASRNGQLLIPKKEVVNLLKQLKRSHKKYNPQESKFKFIDLFAGIGGFRIALCQLGGKCVFSCEWNKFSQETYKTNFGDDNVFWDINDVNGGEIRKHDILTAGFPCQPFSIAGVSKKNAIGQKHGFKCKTQGTLFFNIAEIIEWKKPKAFILENVKNLKSHDKGNTYKTIISTLQDELGYHVYHESNIIDAAYYVPQHRERVFIVGFKNKTDFDRFQFPKKRGQKKQFHSIVSEDVPRKYTLTMHLWNYLQAYAEKHRKKGNGFGYGIVDMDGVSRTISARYYKDGAEVLIDQKPRPRRLTPRESARLMGFPEDFIIPVSDTQAYRQFGNAVVVPVAKAVAKSVVKALQIK